MEVKRFKDIQNSENEEFMELAIKLAEENIYNGGGPFGAVVVKNGKVVGTGVNSVTRNNDPTAHAEVMAIRDACRNLGTFQLDGCEVYTSCFPCAMCYSSIYWARPDVVYYGCNQYDAANVGFDDDFIYKELEKSPTSRRIKAYPLMRDKALKVFDIWKNKNDKIHY